MRFFIEAIVSTLILSPISVLSMETGNDATEVAADIADGPTLSGLPGVADFDLSSASSPSLEKRLCFRRGCNKKSKHASGFQCKKKHFSLAAVEKAKAVACAKIKENKQRNAFPALYTATDFETPGPYLEWPIKRNGRFWNNLRRGRYRIILTENCKVVGAVIRKSNGSYRTCKKLSEKDEDEVDDDDEKEESDD
ncbi:hypothetical protein HI914_06931 [Erysiphe necator]|uniref:Putative secreted effector protein n=1 Tax=Uncinula necator TaxID=52586 RepID=A0A0B1P277_UNCNE|nr:hypothetical protein HI914_06931 [Erysiphe necator]KHJ32368.1 putative secreted effector protein [Erysiphe necator]